ncbi:hypothetical protein IG631_07625 [Alternaria alternata]|nr:hypothetical protein IG631_07625 [Alternaria alternata]
MLDSYLQDLAAFSFPLRGCSVRADTIRSQYVKTLDSNGAAERAASTHADVRTKGAHNTTLLSDRPIPLASSLICDVSDCPARKRPTSEACRVSSPVTAVVPATNPLFSFDNPTLSRRDMSNFPSDRFDDAKEETLVATPDCGIHLREEGGSTSYQSIGQHAWQ